MAMNEAEQLYKFCRQRNEALGRSEGEVARRVICEVEAKQDRVMKMFHAKKISCKEFARTMRILHEMYAMAVQVWNHSPESIAEGWRA
jgi:hypothetical protein